LVEFGHFDSFAHLDYPLRVLEKKMPAPTLKRYEEQVRKVVKGVAERGQALEINTRGAFNWCKHVGPENWILSMFREAGGEYVTIGSDAHSAQDVGNGFSEAVVALKEAGFDSYTIYKKHKPIKIKV
jgi:histidinol-phosphatase (PHP family)